MIAGLSHLVKELACGENGADAKTVTKQLESVLNKALISFALELQKQRVITGCQLLLAWGQLFELWSTVRRSPRIPQLKLCAQHALKSAIGRNEAMAR